MVGDKATQWHPPVPCSMRSKLAACVSYSGEASRGAIHPNKLSARAKAKLVMLLSQEEQQQYNSSYRG
jgi:hypothetical protein